MEEKSEKTNKESFTIPKKAMFGIAPAIAIGGVLISKGDIGPLILFILGIGIGIIIGKGFYQKNN